MEAAGITGATLRWFTDYLNGRRQRVVIPGAMSDWAYIKTGVLQGSILGPILFLVYINDIVTDIGANRRLFADDTSLYIIVENPVDASLCLNRDLQKISNWAQRWLVTYNASKNESMVISRKNPKPYLPLIFVDGIQGR